MTKECVWIHTESDNIVPKVFVEHHTTKCIDKDTVRDAILNQLDLVPHFRDSLLKELKLDG